ncbi:hypothetical protein ACGP04_00915 [Piscirickettsia salmonis]|uniref:hypothetical protein n=1 Tax=Piscirickettsia salmonis TaxID=1238 RepID=UPI0026CC0DD4
MPDVVNDDLEKAFEIETQLEENNRKEVKADLGAPEPVTLKDPKPLIVQGIVEPEQKKQTISPLPSLSEEELKNLQVTLDEEALKKTDDRAVKSLRYLADQYTKINQKKYQLAKKQGQEASFEIPYYRNCLKNDYRDGQGGYWIEEILEEESKLNEEDRIFTNHFKDNNKELYNQLILECSNLTPNVEYNDEGMAFTVIGEGDGPGLPLPNPEDYDRKLSSLSLSLDIKKVTNEFPSSQLEHKGSTDSIGGLSFTQEEEKDLAVNKDHNRTESMDSVLSDQSMTTDNKVERFNKEKVKKANLQKKIKAIVDYIEDKAINNKFTTQGKLIGTSSSSIWVKGEELKNIPGGFSAIHKMLAPLKDGPCDLKKMQSALEFVKEQSTSRAKKKEGLLVFPWNARSQDTINDYNKISGMSL